jgi:hypothetical protein
MCILAKYGASLQYGFGSGCDSASVVSGSEHLTDTNVIGLSDGSYSTQEHCRVGMDSGDLQGSQSYSLGKPSMLSTFCSVVVVAFVVVVVVVVRLLLFDCCCSVVVVAFVVVVRLLLLFGCCSVVVVRVVVVAFVVIIDDSRCGSHTVALQIPEEHKAFIRENVLFALFRSPPEVMYGNTLCIYPTSWLLCD